MTPIKKQPLVSICIPSFNASKYIVETIGSVLQSSYSNIEVIVSDDASMDSTPEIVAGMEENRIRLFRNKRNLGVPGNWNRSINKAKGDYVSLLNHDDLLGPFWLTFAVHTLEKYPHIGWVGSAFRIIDGRGQAVQVVSRLPETGESL